MSYSFYYKCQGFFKDTKTILIENIVIKEKKEKKGNKFYLGKY